MSIRFTKAWECGDHFGGVRYVEQPGNHIGEAIIVHADPASAVVGHDGILKILERLTKKCPWVVDGDFCKPRAETGIHQHVYKLRQRPVFCVACGCEVTFK